MSERDGNGRFAKGNSGGPGRPRREIEADYLIALNDAVSLADWGEVVSKALEDAKAGDGKARAWLAKYLIGDQPPTLESLAVAEHLGESPADGIARSAAERRSSNDLLDALYARPPK